jgi:hypothetical protein
MKTTLSRVLALLAAAGLACSDDDATGPTENTTITGLALTASVVEVTAGGGSGSAKLLSVQVSIRNTTDTTIARGFPAGCAVRIRLYRAGTDELVYDQTQWACEADTSVPFQLPGGQTKTLASPTFFPWNVSGDSLAAGSYRATGVLRLTGESPIELPAGTYRLPSCPLPPECTLVGRGAINGYGVWGMGYNQGDR